LRRSSEV